MIAFLLGPFGKLAEVAVLVIALLGAGALWLHSHDNAVRAAMQVSADKAIAAAQETAHANAEAALVAQADAAQARVAASEALRSQTHSVPPTTACSSSPAVRALHDGLLGHANGPGTSH